MISIDSCGSTYTSRNVSRNIYLTGELSANFVNHIQWQSYQEWINGVSHYNIYRKKETEWIKIDEVSDKKRSFKDNIKQLEDPDGKFCYRVEAVSNPDTFTAPPPKSVSNITCITQYPSIYIPNAFAPKGENKVFKPVLLYADKSDYTMRIYNRWGQLLFETHDPSTGWDGRVGDELMPQGAYMYVIQFTNTDGSSYRDQGSVILVR